MDKTKPVPVPMPAEGGSYTRKPDGSLEREKPAAPPNGAKPATQPAAATSPSTSE